MTWLTVINRQKRPKRPLPPKLRAIVYMLESCFTFEGASDQNRSLFRHDPFAEFAYLARRRSPRNRSRLFLLVRVNDPATQGSCGAQMGEYLAHQLGDPSELPKSGWFQSVRFGLKESSGSCRFLVGLMWHLDWLNSSASSAFLVCGRTAAAGADAVDFSLRGTWLAIWQRISHSWVSRPTDVEPFCIVLVFGFWIIVSLPQTLTPWERQRKREFSVIQSFLDVGEDICSCAIEVFDNFQQWDLCAATLMSE